MNKKRIFSGVQPTGNLHIGNYLGAVSQWVPLQDEYESIFCIVDYHAITSLNKKNSIKDNVIEVAKNYLAAGIDPEKSIIFTQSAIKEHAELTWILNCVSARMSDLENMTQYKDKAEGRNKENVSVGLFDYPVLMAADILLYDTDVVPVGHDQLQHIELARDLAKRFNYQYGETFKVPAALIRKQGARIMGLDDPTKKMSKSAASTNNWVALNDSPEVGAKKIMKAATDSEAIVKLDVDKKPGISNLLTIYSLLTAKTIKDIEKQYTGRGYGDFKKDLAQITADFLSDFQKKANAFSETDIKEIMKSGAEKIRPIAEEKVKQVKLKIGL